jgi:hypothetical protein
VAVLKGIHLMVRNPDHLLVALYDIDAPPRRGAVTHIAARPTAR